MEIIKEVVETKRVKNKKTGEVSEVPIMTKTYYRRENGSLGIRHNSYDLDRCKQSDEKGANINNIVRKHTAQDIFNKFVFDANSDGIIDVSQVPDYHQAMNKIASANTQFEKLPSGIRKRFDNNPKRFMAFVTNPDNMPEMYELGLAKKEITEPPPVPTPPPSPPEGDE